MTTRVLVSTLVIFLLPTIACARGQVCAPHGVGPASTASTPEGAAESLAARFDLPSGYEYDGSDAEGERYVWEGGDRRIEIVVTGGGASHQASTYYDCTLL